LGEAFVWTSLGEAFVSASLGTAKGDHINALRDRRQCKKEAAKKAGDAKKAGEEQGEKEATKKAGDEQGVKEAAKKVGTCRVRRTTMGSGTSRARRRP